MPDHIHLNGHFKNAHAFLSRQDGVSSGIYAGLNCGIGSDDDPELVTENRRIAAALIGGRRDTPILSVYQIHSSDVVYASENWGADHPKADAIVTDVPGLILGILTADCAPVIFEDAGAGVIGIAHAGWKGALGGVLENTIDMMERYGATRTHITAAIGPTIAQASYEVSNSFQATFLEKDDGYQQFFSPGRDADHLQFDLPAFIMKRLSGAGVTAVKNVGADTYANEQFFSFRRTTHRKETDYGRQLSGIMLQG